MLAPISIRELRICDAVEELGALLAPLRLLENLAGEVQPHGMMGRDVVQRRGLLVPGDAVVPQEERLLPPRTPVGRHVVADRLECPQPARVGPWLIDLTPC
jgi:hypothetical protein